jgi:hypothetical protein
LPGERASTAGPASLLHGRSIVKSEIGVIDNECAEGCFFNPPGGVKGLKKMPEAKE